MGLREKAAKRIKARLLRLMERLANRIHPQNESGNNVSRF
jgi:hypothetical protein